MAAILEVDGLTKKFGDQQAVKGISFSVEEGEVFGLLGPNVRFYRRTVQQVAALEAAAPKVAAPKVAA